MTQGDSADRRKARRLVAHIPARFGLEGRVREGAIIDLSEGGLQIRALEAFSTGMVLDVFVQFPRRRLRLRARVAWVRGEPPTMGLTYVQPDKSLLAAYGEWVEETRGITGGGPGAAPGAGAATAAATPAGAPVASAGAVVEPEGPVVRHLETARGNEFDIRMERTASGWRLLIHASPRPSPTAGPAHDVAAPDFASANAALRDFLKSR